VKTGRIKWFNAIQSHGYIILWDGTEVYFHSSSLSQSNLIDHLSAGADVSFDLIETRGGPEAQNIDIIGW
jgi:cold shock CspA family protein